MKEEEIRVSPGSRVNGFGAANESLGSLFMRFDNREQMQQVMKPGMLEDILYIQTRVVIHILFTVL